MQLARQPRKGDRLHFATGRGEAVPSGFYHVTHVQENGKRVIARFDSCAVLQPRPRQMLSGGVGWFREDGLDDPSTSASVEPAVGDKRKR